MRASSKVTETPMKPIDSFNTHSTGEKLLDWLERNFINSNLDTRPRSLLLNNNSDSPLAKTIFSLDISGNYSLFAGTSYKYHFKLFSFGPYLSGIIKLESLNKLKCLVKRELLKSLY